MQPIQTTFCYYCGKKTEILHKEIRRSFGGRIVTIYNVPMFFCRSCREIFYPDFVINLFNAMSRFSLNSDHYKFDLLYSNQSNLEQKL